MGEQPPPPPAMNERLTREARAGVRRFPWRSIAIGAAGASAVGLLGAAGLAPLLLAVVGRQLAEGTLAAWLGAIGGNALAGWAGDLALWAAGKPLASDDEAEALVARQALAAKLDALLAGDARAANELARLLQAIDAVPQSLDAIAEEVGAQSDVLLEQFALLKQLRADVERLGVDGAALGPALTIAADRVIVALEARADHTDARIAEVLAELRALRDEQRQALINFAGAQTGDLEIGDVAGRDMHKPTLGPGSVYAPGGTVVQPFTPRPVAPTSEELAAAQLRLAALPTDAIPEPQDTLPPGSWMARLQRNRQFVGREADLRAMAMLLKGGESVAVNQDRSAVASGLGGIGKTQLAIEFAYRYGRYFAGVFWLSFAQADAVSAETPPAAVWAGWSCSARPQG
ncbi:MAG: hypothetical protein OHK0015_41950 [Chloroflexi bacterium OHK40]